MSWKSCRIALLAAAALGVCPSVGHADAGVGPVGVIADASGVTACAVQAEIPVTDGVNVYGLGAVACGTAPGLASGTLQVCIEHIWQVLPLSWTGPCNSGDFSFEPSQGEFPVAEVIASDDCSSAIHVYQTYASATVTQNGQTERISDESEPIVLTCQHVNARP